MNHPSYWPCGDSVITERLILLGRTTVQCSVTRLSADRKQQLPAEQMGMEITTDLQQNIVDTTESVAEKGEGEFITEDSDPLSKHHLLLTHDYAVLETLANCVNMGWMAILVCVHT